VQGDRTASQLNLAVKKRTLLFTSYSRVIVIVDKQPRYLRWHDSYKGRYWEEL